MEAIEARLSRIEILAKEVQSNTSLETLSPAAKRVVDEVRSKGLLGCALYRVPSGYYSLSLGERAEILGCTTLQLCKTVVFAFPSCPKEHHSQWSRFAVVVQYQAKINMEAVQKFVRSATSATLADVSSIKMAEDAEALTGFSFNSVSPFGMLAAMPLIVSKPVFAHPFVWLGGGEADLKLRVFTSQFVRPFVVDCSIARDDGNGDDME